jgi:hypothetical protein
LEYNWLSEVLALTADDGAELLCAGLATLHAAELPHVVKESNKFICFSLTQQYCIYLIGYQFWSSGHLYIKFKTHYM